MEKLFLEFLERAPRSQKPRTRGLTAILDQGLPIAWVTDMLETWGDYIDIAKFAVTGNWLMPARNLEQRVRLYRDHNVNPAIDDPTFAIAYYQNRAKEYLRTIREVGFTHCQIDTHFVHLGESPAAKKADEDEICYINLARELGLKVDGEVGQKWPEGDRTRAKGGLINVEATVAEIKRLLDAGCEHVYLESRVLREAIGAYGEREEGTLQVKKVVEAVGLEDIFIEITGQHPFDTKMCHRFWAVRNFGPEVNMGGGELIDEVRFIEGIRRGVTYVRGPSNSSPLLWMASLAKNDGKAASDWWSKEPYPIDPAVIRQV